MADLHQFEDEAARYVLGEMDAAERCAFEAQLKRSAELRALVRELEAGGVVAALACPPHQPPPELWQRIERAMTQESRDVVVIAPEPRIHWLPYAWAAAACLVAGLLLGAWLMHNLSGRAPAQAKVRYPSAGSGKEGTRVATTHGTLLLHEAAPGPQRNATNQTSDRPTEPVIDSASHPIQFFSGASASNSALNSPPPPPDLQRALFVAMSRDLGWSSGREPDADDGVDLVDLRPLEAAPVPAPPPMVAATGSLVGFVSGDTLYVAFGSNTVPRAQELQFWAATPDDGEQLLGTATLGENPLVVVAPMSIGGPNGTLTIIGVSATGVSNVFGQLFIAAPYP
jgi:hypothetical protein